MGAPAENPLLLIMAGGSGTRFWPLSSPSLPKQFLPLASSEESLIQQTAERILPLSRPDRLYVVSIESQCETVKEHLPSARIIAEPSARNTAPCLALSVQQLLKEGHSPQVALAVFPADHFIANVPRFHEILKIGLDFASKNDALVTLGITPRFPHTGYGYIQQANAHAAIRPVKQFLEKPSLDRATALLKQGDCYWNSGMFIWTLGSIQKAMETHMPETWNALWNCKPSQLGSVYPTLKSEPIDKAVLEKASNVFVIPADLEWSDLGSWNALHELKAAKESDNIIEGSASCIESTGCYVRTDGSQIAVIGLQNVIVVEANGKILVCERKSDQLVKKAAEEFPLE